MRVGGRGHEHGGAVVLDHLDMALGVARARGDHGAAQALQPVVQAEAAGEHAVAEGHLARCRRARRRPSARGGRCTRSTCPCRRRCSPPPRAFPVVPDEECSSRDVVQRHREQAEGEGLAQHGLVGEGELAHVLERLDVARRHAHLVQLLAVVRTRARRSQATGLLQLLQLQGANLLAGGALDFRLVNGQGVEPSRLGGAQRRTLLCHVDGIHCLAHAPLRLLRGALGDDARDVLLGNELHRLVGQKRLGALRLACRRAQCRWRSCE